MYRNPSSMTIFIKLVGMHKRYRQKQSIYSNLVANRVSKTQNKVYIAKKEKSVFRIGVLRRTSFNYFKVLHTLTFVFHYTVKSNDYSIFGERKNKTDR